MLRERDRQGLMGLHRGGGRELSRFPRRVQVPKNTQSMTPWRCVFSMFLEVLLGFLLHFMLQFTLATYIDIRVRLAKITPKTAIVT